MRAIKRRNKRETEAAIDVAANQCRECLFIAECASRRITHPKPLSAAGE
jgi:hypothetical protein